MSTLVAQVSPERSSQYAALAHALAPVELALSPLSSRISGGMDGLHPIAVAGRHYVQFDLSGSLTAGDRQELGQLAATTAFFEWFDRLQEGPGPWLRPIETTFQPALPADLPAARRYRGKTNELFTHFLCNVARFSSAHARAPWETLRLFDPLAGGGTTLLTGLVLGADVAGVERGAGDVESTAGFLKQYLDEQAIPYRLREERLRKLGHRWTFIINRGRERQCILARGDTTASHELIDDFRPHLIAADLPYGIQHRGELTQLLHEALPAWAGLLQPGGAIALAWDATRFTRAEMLAEVTGAGLPRPLQDPPYDRLAHRVDRVIKRRDVVVMR